LGVLCDKRIPMKLKGKFYKCNETKYAIEPVLGRRVDRRIEQSINVADMRMLRWMRGVRRKDIIRNK